MNTVGLLVLAWISVLLLYFFVCEEDRRRVNLGFRDYYQSVDQVMGPYNTLIQWTVPIEQSTPFLPMNLFPQHSMFENNWLTIKTDALQTSSASLP